MKVRVVGGGWYGCHIALNLLKLGHDVELYEKGVRLFAGASGNNQSRLHLGFHYPRDAVTRCLARDEARTFLASEYGQFTRAVETNIYAVASRVSLLDYETYRAVMASSGIQFVELQPNDFGLYDLDGAILTGERLILEDQAARYFAGELGAIVRFRSEVGDLRKEVPDYDWTIDCTFGSHDIHLVEWYEPCCMALYRGEGVQRFALTVMDGPEGVSLYPYYLDNTVSLTSVAETPLRDHNDRRLRRPQSMAHARDIIGEFLSNDVWQERILETMEAKLIRYLPEFFDDGLAMAGWACSVRVKPVSGSDRRAVVVTPRPEDRIITVFPGKITGIFDAWARVADIVGLSKPNTRYEAC